MLPLAPDPPARVFHVLVEFTPSPVSDTCTWQHVFDDEYVHEVQLVGGEKPKSISTWYDGKSRALVTFTDRKYGPGPLVQLVMKSNHSSYKLQGVHALSMAALGVSCSSEKPPRRRRHC